MVSVRKSHHLSEESFEQWLSNLDITDSKESALEQLWHSISNKFNQPSVDENIETKSLEMVEILASLNMDKDSLCAAMLIPLFTEGLIDIALIETSYGNNIASLVVGVNQMEAIRSLHRSANSKVGANQIDNVRKMLLSMVDDIRAVVIKLAERVCHLRAVKNADEETRVLVAKEIANIYAPLANRLGIGQVKWELEDISFRYLHPDVYKKIAKLLDEKRLDREQYVDDFVSSIQQKLKEQGINGSVYGRPKHIYSIWKKMQKKSLDFTELYDVRAVRVVVEKLQDCYAALGIVHTSWQHLHSEFDDYVATPKPNGYQSIHTVVLGPNGKSVEIQIRTQQMHDDAELGVAAHWRYKEGSGANKNSGFDEKVGWLRKILQWQDDVTENGSIIDELRSQVFEDRIYVFTPKGDVIDLPANSTPLDFAYYIHSNIGHRCIGAKVFGKIVPFTHILQTGDKVEILTSKTPNPSRDWLNPSLNYIHSSRARSKVQSYFKLLDKDKNSQIGKELLDNELAKIPNIQFDANDVLNRFNMTTLADLHAAIGATDISLQQVVNFIQREHDKKQPKSDVVDPKLLMTTQRSKPHKVDNNGIMVSGVGNLLTHMAKCCQPVYGDAVIGFITQGRGISVHRSDCEQLKHLLDVSPEREVEVQWGNTELRSVASIQVIAIDRFGLLRDVSTLLANERIGVLNMATRHDDKTGTAVMSFSIEVTNISNLQRLLAKISQIDDVVKVIRVEQ